MTDQPPSDRFKSEMPQIPGISGSRSSAASNPGAKLVIGLLAVLLVVFLGAHADPGIAVAEEMAKPWSSKEFFIRNHLTGEDVPGLLVRLPTGSSSQAGGYWAFEQKSPYGDCKLEYVTDLNKLKKDYGFRNPTHPMVGNPCSRTVFDPLKTANLPGGSVWVRGSIVQGSDLRPPLGIEIKVDGKKILAVRTE